MREILVKSKLLIAALIILGFTAGTIPAKAYGDDEKCEKKIHKAEEKLEKAIQKHGEHSPQAEEKRHQLEETRERCHHDHDHDHDHDQH